MNVKERIKIFYLYFNIFSTGIESENEFLNSVSSKINFQMRKIYSTSFAYFCRIIYSNQKPIWKIENSSLLENKEWKNFTSSIISD